VQHLSCSDAGCVDGEGAERIGWDLPALHGETVTASPEPAKPVGVEPPPPPSALPPLELACKPAGRVATMFRKPGSQSADSGSSDARWAISRRDPDGKTSVVFGAQNQVREALLLSATPKVKPGPGKATTSFLIEEFTLDDGLVATRFRRSSDADGKHQRVDLELGWWSNKTMRAHRVELKKAAPPEASSGTPQIVDGGLLFQPSGGTDVFFVHDDGKVDTFAVPRGVTVRNAERVGTAWLLAEENHANIRLYLSKDGGKVWTRSGWGLDTSGDALLGLIDGKPMVSLSSRTGLPTLLFAVGGAPANDPPAPVIVDPKAIEGACDAHVSGRRAVSDFERGQRWLEVWVHVAKNEPPAGHLSAPERVTHTTATGAMCTSAWILQGMDPKTGQGQWSFIYPAKKGFSGWWFQSAEDPTDVRKPVTYATPLTCEPKAP
jgi:hypothetical protein